MLLKSVKIKIPCGPVVYIIHCKNGRIYIGCSDNYLYRIGTHFMQLSKGTHLNTALQKDFDKFGPSGFHYSVIAQFKSMKSAYSFEAKTIKNTNAKTYNKIHTGGGWKSYHSNRHLYVC